MSKQIQLVSGILTGVDNPYDVGGYQLGLPGASAIVLAYLFRRTVIYPASLTNSAGKATVAATAITTYSIKQNGTEVGTMVFAAAASTATFTMPTQTTFVSGDEITVVAPASPDATLAGVRFTLVGTR